MATSKEIDRLDIDAYVAHARAMRNEAMGELIFAAARAARVRLAGLTRRLARLLHAHPAAQH